MEARHKPLVAFMEGSDKNFIIPIYQRNYDWKKENCKQLFDDIEDMLDKNLESHFFGSLVGKAETGSRIIIIDGQQRLTTISLLFLAMYNYIVNSNMDDQDSTIIKEKILELYLTNKWADAEKKIRLKTIKKDEEAYARLFDNDETRFVSNSTLTQNYLYLYKRISESNHSVKELYDGIGKLMIVDVQLQENDNAQLVFESMNSTGLDLSEADKIRNYVLMEKPYNEQKELYEKYWNEIEKNVNYETTQYIKDYLTVQLNVVPNQNSIYKAFKEDLMILKRGLDISEVLKEMFEYSIIYKKLRDASFSDASVNKYIEDINYLRYFLTYPFLLRVIHRYDNCEMRIEDLINLLKTLTSYLVRRIIAGKPSNALQKYFCVMDKEIMARLEKQNLDMTMYDDVFAYIILNKQGTAEYVGDREFIDSFKKYKLYKAQSQVRIYVLKELENSELKGGKIDYSMFDSDNGVSIEHIMPQTLTSDWQSALGENYQEIHETYLHTIGNLTLIGANADLSNMDYLSKKNHQYGYDHSNFALNNYFKDINEWNEEQITRRADILANKAVKLWETAETTYVPDVDDETSCVLADEDVNYKFSKVIGFSVNEIIYKVDSFRDLLIKFADLLFNEDKMPLINHADQEWGKDERIKTTRKPESLVKAYEVGDGIFIEVNYSANRVIDSMRQLAEIYGKDLNDIVIFLK